jgi:hypothetical protein
MSMFIAFNVPPPCGADLAKHLDKESYRREAATEFDFEGL